MKKQRKTKIKDIDKFIGKVGSRFCSLSYIRKGKNESCSAKIIRSTPSYLTVFNTSNQEEVRLHRNSIDRITCGNYAYSS